ncbi:Dut dUTPase [uncultured Caudovirales phage]|uniref:dUTP diphosphatase n=1 Tax=uncultured Caudovirales phage TaxID=2100421 RepID=A0A6J5MBU0_9CAUD|nr:Dut dUTPase [uncultured Caudovirales phage]
MNNLGFYKLSPEAKLPTYGTSGAACFDFYSFSEDTYLYPGQKEIFNIGLIPVIPEGFSLRIHPRSGLAFKHSVTLVNAEGIIDEDYADEMKVALYMFEDVYDYNQEPVLIKKFDRIAQGELVKNEKVFIYEQFLRPGKIGNRDGGFGSTGN